MLQRCSCRGHAVWNCEPGAICDIMTSWTLTARACFLFLALQTASSARRKTRGKSNHLGIIGDLLASQMIVSARFHTSKPKGRRGGRKKNEDNYYPRILPLTVRPRLHSPAHAHAHAHTCFDADYDTTLLFVGTRTCNGTRAMGGGSSLYTTPNTRSFSPPQPCNWFSICFDHLLRLSTSRAWRMQVTGNPNRVYHDIVHFTETKGLADPDFDGTCTSPSNVTRECI